MKWSRLVRSGGRVPLACAVVLCMAATAFAQEVNEDYIVNHLGPAAEEMEWAGLDGSPDSTPAMIEIGQRWGIDPAYWIGVDEVHSLLREAREDRERTRLGASLQLFGNNPSRLTLARYGVVLVGLTCGQAQERARTAQRLADSLSRASQLNGVGTGLVGVLSQGAARFVGPMAFATMVTGFASAWAGQLATAYRTAPCLAGGQLWRFRPNVLKASFSHAPSHIPPSSPGERGPGSARWLIGTTFWRPAPACRFSSRSASGRWRSS